MDDIHALLGFHPLEGGRRLGEMVVKPLSDGTLWLEIPGTLVTAPQAAAISRTLRAVPNPARQATQAKHPCQFCRTPHRTVRNRLRHERTCPQRRTET